MSSQKQLALSLDLELPESNFKQFSGLMYELAGVDLPFSPKNVALVKNRLTKVMRRHGISQYKLYWDLLKKGDQKDISEFISALTTNMTSFFREPAHFDWLGKYMTTEYKNTELRVWCAAASIGKEPYTIATKIASSIPENQWSKIKILATDIDLEVLDKGAKGFYSETDVDGLKPDYLSRFFDRGIQNGERGYQIKKTIASMLKFAQFNLMNEHYQFKKPMDVIFCRNVLIYFDEKTTQNVIDRMVRCLNVGGYLVLGHSESGSIKHPHLQVLSNATYRRIK